MQKYCRPLTASLIALLVGTSQLLLAPVKLKAEPERLATVSISGELDSQASKFSLSFRFNLAQREAILTTYNFPNLWGLHTITQLEQANPNRGKAIINSEFIQLDFSSNPLKPQTNYELRIVATGKAVSSFSSVKFFKSSGGQLAESGTQLANYELRFPTSWGRPSYVNLNQGSYQADNSALYLKQLDPLFLLWGNSLQASINYQTEDQPSQALQLLVRQSLTQRLHFPTNGSIKAIYRDDSGNIYPVFSQAANPVAIGLSLDLTSKPAQPATNLNTAYQRLSLPKQLKPELEQIHFQTKPEPSKVSQVINLIRSRYSIGPVSDHKFEIAANQIKDKQAINYAEYVVLLNESLAYAGLPNKIILVDLRPYNLLANFWVEICQTGDCNYYQTEPNLGPNEQRLAPGLAIQVIAFDGLNQLAFSKIRAFSADYLAASKITYLPANQQALTELNPQADDKLAISMQLPAQTENFKNFQTTVEISNNTSEVIFLNSLQIEKNTFPIINNTLGGVHQGVLPGETKSFIVDNVFLPQFFVGARRRSNFEIQLNYEKAGQEYNYITEHSVLLEQNFLFMSLLALAMLALLTSILTLIMIYQHNKYLFISSYWHSWRWLEDWVWSIRQTIRRFKSKA